MRCVIAGWVAWCWVFPAFAAVINEFHYVEDAALVSLDHVHEGNAKLSPEEFLIARLFRGHEIVKGDRIVSIMRQYSSEDKVADSGSFTKVSIELPKFESSSPVTFDLSTLRSYYSRGSTTWALKGGGRYASSLSGWVTISRSGNTWQVTLEVSGTAEQLKWAKTSLHEIAMKESFEATEIKHNLLTPWLGARFPAHEWYKAAAPYRPRY